MGTGLPPQTPPDFYSSQVVAVGVVGVVLTRRRESADYLRHYKIKLLKTKKGVEETGVDLFFTFLHFRNRHRFVYRFSEKVKYYDENPPTPPACESNQQHPQQSTLYIYIYIQIENRGEFEGGDPYGTLTPTQRAPMGPEGCRRLPIGSGHWSCFWRKPHAKQYFHCLTPTPRLSKAVRISVGNH